MTKKLKKLGTILIILYLFMSTGAGIVLAQEPAPTPTTSTSTAPTKTEAQDSDDIKALSAVFDKINQDEFQCIPRETAEKKPYIITIVEEPLIQPKIQEDSKKTTKAMEEGVPYISILCFRNTFSYSFRYKEGDGENEKEKYETSTITTLAVKCSDEAKRFADQYKFGNDPNYNANFFCQPVQVILSRGGTSLIEGYIRDIYTWAAGLVGLIAVSVIIISGIQIAASGGDSQAIESSKTRIIQSIAGIALLFLSGLILYTINPNFFVRNPGDEETPAQEEPAGPTSPTPPGGYSAPTSERPEAP